MNWSVEPEPSDETEREVLLAAVEQAFAELNGRFSAYATPWWRSGLPDSGGSAAPQQPGNEPRVVEP